MSNPGINGNEKPLVSVCVMTYNHKAFIAQCLDSILEQKTDFDFEICIGEDESTDGTREKCIEYATNFPALIRLSLNKRSDVVYVNGHPTAQGNFSKTMKQAKGKYLVLCDGDDFWCDPLKLQKQANFLETNNELSGCFHRISRVDQYGNLLCKDCGPAPGNRTRYSQADFLQHGGFSPLFSVMFKNRFKEGLPAWFMDIEYVDLPLHIVNTAYGDYGFINDVMGCYRIHSGGMASGQKRSKIVAMAIRSYNVMDANLTFSSPEAYKKGLKALKFSFRSEKVLEILLPGRLKYFFDQSIGRWIRRLARKCIGG